MDKKGLKLKKKKKSLIFNTAPYTQMIADNNDYILYMEYYQMNFNTVPGLLII